ncbi:MAG: DUF4919 domain-containing protein [Bacteroidales bacterium]|nr:DUF4919 domain-containing protein [Bacteroidales bacterium]
MKKLFSVLAFLFLVSLVFSQDTKTKNPDYEQIKREITKRKSDYYYPVLMKKYLEGDTNMTLKEKRFLYYGFTFQDNYSPYGRSDYSDSVRNLIKKQNHSDKELREIVRYGDSALIFNPFDLRVLNYQLYALEELERPGIFNNRLARMRTVFDVLLSSGDGLSKKTAFYVIFTTHEYDLLGLLGYDFGGQQSLIDHYDYLTVEKNPEEIEGLYFDVSPCLKSLNSEFE